MMLRCDDIYDMIWLNTRMTGKLECTPFISSYHTYGMI